MDEGWHSKDGKQLAQTLDDGRGGHVWTRERKRKPRELIYDGQEVGVLGRRRKWAFEVQTQPLEGLSGLDEGTVFWLVESGF